MRSPGARDEGGKNKFSRLMMIKRVTIIDHWVCLGLWGGVLWWGGGCVGGGCGVVVKDKRTKRELAAGEDLAVGGARCLKKRILRGEAGEAPSGGGSHGRTVSLGMD